MPKPVCVPCQRFYRPKTNGYTWVEGRPDNNNALPGTQEPEKWTDYKVWQSDLWECKGCGHLLIVGHGRGPVAEDFQENFKAEANACELRVNDC